MELKTLIAECTAYDFKVMLEEKKPKSWLKSVSAFANGLGGSLFFGIDNDGIVKGLDDVQHVCEAISSKIRDYMDPLPEVEMIPHDMDGLRILQLKVNAGHYTPYYYVGDGQRIAFVRVGDESLPATAEQMVRLVLKGSNKTFDSLHTGYKAEDYSFTILANTFKDRTKQEWDKKYLLSFGLVTGEGNQRMQVHCLPMIVHCGSLAYTAHDGMERKRAMPSTMQSLQVMSSCCSVKP